MIEYEGGETTADTKYTANSEFNPTPPKKPSNKKEGQFHCKVLLTSLVVTIIVCPGV
jgi:hypothetical protein